MLVSMKKILLLLSLIISGSIHSQSKLFQPGWQLSFGAGVGLQRLDANFDSLSRFFNGDATLQIPAQPAIRLYNKPMFGVELNYIHNLQNTITWKAGLTGSIQQIAYSYGNTYKDSSSIKLSSAGIQAQAIKAFHPTEGSILMIGIGASIQGVFLQNTQIINRIDTLVSFQNYLNVSATSNLDMNLTSKLLIQGIASLEWINKLNDHWSLSASIQGRLPLTDNFNFTGTTIANGKLDLFGNSIAIPISTTTATTSSSRMPYCQFNIGIIRTLNMKHVVVSNLP